jgi:hypothetical protein
VTKDKEINAESLQVNPGYALGQLANALTTSEEHRDLATRKRAEQKAAKWLQVFEGVLDGSLAVGSRTPLSGTPGWATLEVVTGGFATGGLLAGGPLLDHERELLSRLPDQDSGSERLRLNRYFLTDEGISQLQEALASGRYEIDVPEEGVLLVVAWLLKNGHAEMARSLLDEMGLFFEKLRFYPIPADRPHRFGARVCLQTVGAAIDSLDRTSPNPRILAQKEAVEVWGPLFDETLVQFLETVDGDPPVFASDSRSADTVIEGGWPCRIWPDGWKVRAQELLDKYARQRKKHTLCGKPERKGENFYELRQYLRRCVEDSESPQDRDVTRIRVLLARCVARRGVPTSSRFRDLRGRQAQQVAGPTHHEVSKVVESRLQECPANEGLEDLAATTQPVTDDEAERFRIAASSAIPESVVRKVERCLIETTDVLIGKGIIKSGETLARVLPQVTGDLQAAGITEPALRQLYAAIYRSFRRRRSLLLLNLESQIKIEELPWVAAINKFRRYDLTARELAKETLKEIVALTVVSFPQAIVPNKLLQELRGLAKQAKLKMPLVDEVAADIFMGQFSNKFLFSAKKAGELLEGTLYATYFDIDYAEVQKLPEREDKVRSWFGSRPQGDAFAEFCAKRAGVKLGGWDVAANGMIIEQQQILTSQNLAVLFQGLGLVEEVQGHLDGMARKCFAWICARQQVNSPTWHAKLITLKNTAYAWRQMVFYLSLLPPAEIRGFVAWANDHLNGQRPEFREQFGPAFNGLRCCAEGRSMDDKEARQFLGWTKGRHWLLRPETKR